MITYRELFVRNHKIINHSRIVSNYSFIRETKVAVRVLINLLPKP
jgi:hypothetical protein